MAATRRRRASRSGVSKARSSRRAAARHPTTARRTKGLSTAEQNRPPDSQFAFPKQRKEPITDAKHVRNAVARFDQVEGVSNADRDRAWRRIRQAARKYGVEIHERGWRQLMR